MNKKLLFSLLIVIATAVGIVLIIQKGNDKSFPAPKIDQDGRTIIYDCRDIKLYVGGEVDDSVSGLGGELDVEGNSDKKTLSIGLPERIYGPLKRLEVSYAKLSDYESCSPDVKEVINTFLSSPQQ